MYDLDHRYNACSDVRIQMLGSDGTAFAVGSARRAAEDRSTDEADFHAHVYLEDAKWEVRIFGDDGATRHPVFESVEAGIGYAVLKALGQRANGERTAEETALDALAPRARAAETAA